MKMIKEKKTVWLTRDMQDTDADACDNSDPTRIFFWNEPPSCDANGNFNSCHPCDADWPHECDTQHGDTCDICDSIAQSFDASCSSFEEWEKVTGIKIKKGTCVKMILESSRPETLQDEVDAALKCDSKDRLRKALKNLKEKHWKS